MRGLPSFDFFAFEEKLAILFVGRKRAFCCHVAYAAFADAKHKGKVGDAPNILHHYENGLLDLGECLFDFFVHDRRVIVCTPERSEEMNTYLPVALMSCTVLRTVCTEYPSGATQVSPTAMSRRASPNDWGFSFLSAIVLLLGLFSVTLWYKGNHLFIYSNAIALIIINN